MGEILSAFGRVPRRRGPWRVLWGNEGICAPPYTPRHPLIGQSESIVTTSLVSKQIFKKPVFCFLAKKKRCLCVFFYPTLPLHTQKRQFMRGKNLQEDIQGMNGKGCTKCGNLIHGQHQMLGGGLYVPFKNQCAPPYAGPWVHPDPKTIN